MSRQVSVESAKASVTVDVDGGPSSIPEELQEAGKIPFLPFLPENTYPDTVERLPSVPETQEDIAELAEAVRNLAQLTIFSSTFRYILRDVFISTRAILARSVAAVGEAASEVQITANTVEPLIDPENDLSTTLNQQLSTVVGEAASNTAQVISLVGEEVTDQAKNIVINRIQEASTVLTTAVSSPNTVTTDDDSSPLFAEV